MMESRKSILFKWFGLGGIPESLRPVLEEEGIVLSAEGIRGRIVKRHVRQPGVRCTYRSESFPGSLTITQKRITCFTFRKRQMSLPVTHPNLSSLFVHVPKENTLSIAFESSEFHDDWTGVFEFRFKTDQAEAFKETLLLIGAQHGTPVDADQMRPRS